MFSVENVGTDVRGIATLASFVFAANPLAAPETSRARNIAIDLLVFMKNICPSNFKLGWRWTCARIARQ
jgi:hypothetical protein